MLVHYPAIDGGSVARQALSLFFPPHFVLFFFFLWKLLEFKFQPPLEFANKRWSSARIGPISFPPRVDKPSSGNATPSSRFYLQGWELLTFTSQTFQIIPQKLKAWSRLEFNDFKSVPYLPQKPLDLTDQKFFNVDTGCRIFCPLKYIGKCFIVPYIPWNMLGLTQQMKIWRWWT